MLVVCGNSWKNMRRVFIENKRNVETQMKNVEHFVGSFENFFGQGT